MKNTLLVAFSIIVSLYVVGRVLSLPDNTDNTHVPEKIINTVVVVEESSGIVVHSDSEKTLILTAFHVIKNKVDVSNNVFEPITVSLKHFVSSNIVIEDVFNVSTLVFDAEFDLALLEVGQISYDINAAVLVNNNNEPRLGDEIWIAGNPLKNYRSLKRGEISSKENRFNISGSQIWEIGGGAIFGASGGGIFTTDGRLSGIIVSVAVMRLACNEVIIDSDNIFEDCIIMPVSYIGHVAPPNIIRSFLINSSFKEYFKYMVEG